MAKTPSLRKKSVESGAKREEGDKEAETSLATDFRVQAALLS
jgi:hypothetical protein